MKIALLGDYPIHTEQVRGGVEAASAYLVKGLARIGGLDVHIFTFSSHGQPSQPGDGVTLHTLPPLPRFERVRNYAAYQAILEEQFARLRPDVVHAQGATAHAYAALRTGYPTLVTIHGIRGEDRRYYGSFGQRMRGYFDSLLIERAVVRRARYVVAISRYVTTYFASYFRVDVQIDYIPNAIDESFFRLHGGDGRAQVILFAGRVIPGKRVLDLARAFAGVARRLPEARLRIAGALNSEKGYVHSVRTFIHGAGLEDRVHLLGELPEAAILEEFDRCSVLALPSAQENLPMVIAQAMAAGKPVVATRVGGVAEMVGDGVTGFLVDVGDVDGLEHALLRLLEDSALRARMGRAGREFALANYRQERVAQRTHEVYRRIACGEA